MIYKRQLKFYRKFRNSCRNNPEATISKIFQQAVDKNISFLRHYKELNSDFSDPEECYKHHISVNMNNIEEKIKASHSADSDSILGTYYRINPEIKSPFFYHKPMCMETDRIIITQYRTGSHILRIQTGRSNEEQRNFKQLIITILLPIFRKYKASI